MRRRRIHLLCLILLCGAGVLPAARPAMAQAQAGQAATAGRRESASAERERLRGELTRVQAEIDRLKSGARGLRTDYLLRARLADAEALARRLTELDVLLKPQPDSAATRAAAGVAPMTRDEAAPSPTPTDGPAELEAKADILTDEARRAQAQAIALQARIDQVRGRRELHKRARQLENDPFAPLESSRRRVATGSAATSAASYNGTTQAPTRTIVVGPALPTPGSATGLASTPSPPTTPPTPVASAAAPAVQVHDVLDPGASAQARRSDAALSAGLSPTADLESMERALAGLNARAQRLDAQAKALRTRAHAR